MSAAGAYTLATACAEHVRTSFGREGLREL
jgi:hypothetical protein